MKTKKKTKKPGYQFGVAPQMTGGQQPSGWQTAGSLLQGVGGIASMFPGIGTAVGMGLAGVGSIMQVAGKPQMTAPVNMNSNPYGYQMGGKIQQSAPVYAMGGQLNPLASDSFEVKGNNPMSTDGVDMGSFKLDHNEVVAQGGVFSDSIQNPVTGRSFAKDAKAIQKALGKAQKNKTKSGDTEFQDEKILNMDTQKLFQQQEKVAQSLGLREPNGMPVQGPQMGMQYGGKKPSFQYGLGMFPYNNPYGEPVSEGTYNRMGYDTWHSNNAKASAEDYSPFNSAKGEMAYGAFNSKIDNIREMTRGFNTNNPYYNYEYPKPLQWMNSLYDPVLGVGRRDLFDFAKENNLKFDQVHVPNIREDMPNNNPLEKFGYPTVTFKSIEDLGPGKNLGNYGMEFADQLPLNPKNLKAISDKTGQSTVETIPSEVIDSYSAYSNGNTVKTLKGGKMGKMNKEDIPSGYKNYTRNPTQSPISTQSPIETPLTNGTPNTQPPVGSTETRYPFDLFQNTFFQSIYDPSLGVPRSFEGTSPLGPAKGSYALSPKRDSALFSPEEIIRPRIYSENDPYRDPDEMRYIDFADARKDFLETGRGLSLADFDKYATDPTKPSNPLPKNLSSPGNDLPGVTPYGQTGDPSVNLTPGTNTYNVPGRTEFDYQNKIPFTGIKLDKEGNVESFQDKSGKAIPMPKDYQYTRDYKSGKNYIIPKVESPYDPSKPASFAPQISTNTFLSNPTYTTQDQVPEPPRKRLSTSPLSVAGPGQISTGEEYPWLKTSGYNPTTLRDLPSVGIVSPLDTPTEQPMPTLDPTALNNSNAASPDKQGLYGSTNEDLIKRMRELHPFGTAAGTIGGAVSAMSTFVNRPFYVNYQNVGRDEITQQNKALRRVVEGEKSALQGVTNSSRAASAQLSNRSLQARNANLRNIAAGEAQSQGQIKGQFAGLEGQMRNQIGARRTAIDQANLQKNMMQDQINTQEYDTLQKENLKALMNFREIALEKQGVMNQVRQDEILKGLLKTRNFEWNSDTNEIVMRALQGDPNALGMLSSYSTSTSKSKKSNNNNFMNWMQKFGKQAGLPYNTFKLN